MGLFSKLKRSLSRRQLKHPPRIEPACEDEQPVPALAAKLSAEAAATAVPKASDKPASEAPNTSAPSTPPSAPEAAQGAATQVAEPVAEPVADVTVTKQTAAASAEDAAAAKQAAMDEANAKFLGEARRIFGPDACTRLQSEKWSERNFAVGYVHENLAGICGGAGAGGATNYSMEDVFNLVVELVSRCTDDKVAPLFFSGVGLFGELLDAHSSAVDAIQVRDSLCTLVPKLIAKLGNSNTRIQREACNSVLQLARSASLGGLAIVGPVLLDESLAIRPRLTVLRILVPETRLAKGTALTLTAVMGVATPALRIPDPKTRKAAVGLVVACYKIGGRRVQRHLVNIKPAMVKILHREFEAATGSAPTSAATPGSSKRRRRHRRNKSENVGASPIRHRSVGNIGDVSHLKSPPGAMKPPLLTRDRSAYLAPLPVSPMPAARSLDGRAASAPTMETSPMRRSRGGNFGAAESIFNLGGASSSQRIPFSPISRQSSANEFGVDAKLCGKATPVQRPTQPKFFDDDDEQIMDDILACI